MSVNALKPTFTDREGYLNWRRTWKIVYVELSKRIRNRKLEVRELQRSGEIGAPKAQREFTLMRRDATKMMTLLSEAKLRRDRIIQMVKDIAEQPFPYETDANIVDIFYNRAANEFAFLPKWTVKVKGKSYYCRHIDATVPWSTRELDSGSTKGMLRFRKCRLMISSDSTATLTAK